MRASSISEFEALSKGSEPDTQMSFTMNSGGFVPSILTLGSSMLGIGFLTLPQIGQQSGMIPMVLMIFVSVIICLIGNLQITRAYFYTKQKTYAEVVLDLDGQFAYKAATFFIMMYMYLVSAVFYVFCPQLLFSFLNNTNSRPHWLTDEASFSKYMTIASFMINFFSSLTPRLSSLRYFSFLSAVVCIIVTVATVWSVNDYKRGYQQKGATVVYFKLDSSLFGSYCLSFLSTMNQFGVVNVLHETTKPSVVRMYKIIFASIVIPFICYIGIAIAGYSICGDKCPDIITNILPPPGHSNPIIEYCKLLFVLCLMVGIILRNQISHTTLMDRAFHQSENRSKQETIEFSPCTFFISSFLNALFPAVLSLSIQRQVLKKIQVGFGLFSPLIVIVFPCRMSIMLHERKLMRLSVLGLWVTKRYMELFTVVSYVCLVVVVYKNLTDL